MKLTTVAGVQLLSFQPGYATATRGGCRIEVEYQETYYGDKGWMALVDGKPVTDYPRPTRKAAVAVAVATIDQR